MKPKAYNI